MAVAHNLNIAGRLAFGQTYPLKSVESEFMFMAVSSLVAVFGYPRMWLVGSWQKAGQAGGVREQHTG